MNRASYIEDDEGNIIPRSASMSGSGSGSKSLNLRDRAGSAGGSSLKADNRRARGMSVTSTGTPSSLHTAEDYDDDEEDEEDGDYEESMGDAERSSVVTSGGESLAVTGFAVASNRRNVDFHALFPEVDEGDYLIEGERKFAWKGF